MKTIQNIVNDKAKTVSGIQWGNLDRPVVLALLCSLIFAGLSLGLYFVFFSGTVETNKTSKYELDRIKGSYAQIQSLEEDYAQVEKYSVIVDALQYKLESKHRSSDIVSQLSALFRKANVMVLNENYVKPKTRYGFLVTEAEFLIEGSYSEIRTVMNGFSKLTFIVNITTAKIQFEKDSGMITLEVKVDIVSINGGKSE